MGAITLSAAGDGEVDLGQITLTSNLESIAITLADEGDVTIANMTAGGDIGTITIGGAASATANFGNIDASSIGLINVSGAGFVDFGTISAVSLAGVDVDQMTSGTFNINLSTLTNATEISLGRATNTVISGAGNDVITLTAGVTGNDNIQYTTATQGTDNIIGFFAGTTGGDQIELSGSGMLLRNGDNSTAEAADDVSFLVLGSTASAMAATANMIVLTSAAANTGAMINMMSSQVSFGTAVASGNQVTLAVVWTDGSDSYLTTVLVGTTGAAGTTTALASAASVTATNTTLAVISGVTPGALVAANFDFV
jgi:hypothetical protein